MPKWFGLPLIALVLGSCSGGSVDVHGRVLIGSEVSVVPVVGTDCDDNPAAGRTLTFMDQDGKVIATTTTVGVDAEKVAGGGVSGMAACHFTASYEVSLPRADFYQVRIEDSTSTLDPIAFSALQADGFTYDVVTDTLGG